MEYTVTKLEQEVIDSKQKSDFYKKRLRAFRVNIIIIIAIALSKSKDQYCC